MWRFRVTKLCMKCIRGVKIRRVRWYRGLYRFNKDRLSRRAVSLNDCFIPLWKACLLWKLNYSFVKAKRRGAIDAETNFGTGKVCVKTVRPSRKSSGYVYKVICNKNQIVCYPPGDLDTENYRQPGGAGFYAVFGGNLDGQLDLENEIGEKERREARLGITTSTRE